MFYRFYDYDDFQEKVKERIGVELETREPPIFFSPICCGFSTEAVDKIQYRYFLEKIEDRLGKVKY